MPFEAFLTYFAGVSVCFCRDAWVARIGLDLVFDVDARQLSTVPVVRLCVPHSATVEFIGLHQKDKREQNAPDQLDLTCFVFREQADGSRKPVTHLKTKTERQQFMQLDPETGPTEKATMTMETTYTRAEVDQALVDFAFELGERDLLDELERTLLRVGQ